MKQQRSESTIIQPELEAALSQIQALEGRLAQQERIIRARQEDHNFREAVVERAAEGVCVCHDIPTYPFVRFTVWNRRMIEITGYTMEEINARGWYQAMYPDPEVQARARERMERMRQGDDLQFERWEIMHACGEKRVLGISTSILTAADKSVHVLGLIHDYTEEQRLFQEAVNAHFDELTGVKNRRIFRANAETLFKVAARQTQPVALAYLDVDDLKTINDTLGHKAGDEVLIAVGKTLLDSLRSTDVAGRLGGDEFALVLLDMSPSTAKEHFTRLHQRLLKIMRDRGWVTGVSMGVVCYSDSIPDVEEAVIRADALMYKAKKNGKSRLYFEE